MDEPREALWQRNIAAYWRARAAKSRNPEARSHLNATAAHHQELAQAFRAPPKSAHFAFACAPKQQLILISAGKILTDAIYLDPCGAILRFTAAHGPGSLIPRPFGGREIQSLLEFAFAIGRQKAIPRACCASSWRRRKISTNSAAPSRPCAPRPRRRSTWCARSALHSRSSAFRVRIFAEPDRRARNPLLMRARRCRRDLVFQHEVNG